MPWDFKKTLVGSDILIVDDNAVNLKVLSKVLEGKGYVVRACQSGEQALISIEEKKPDLVLLDVQMPGIDGFDVCQRIKSNHDTDDIPVIFITASDTVESKIKGFEVGATDYIPRPLQMPEVLARVQNQLAVQMLYRLGEEEKERLQKLLASLPVPYMLSSVDSGKMLEMNVLACKALGVSSSDVRGMVADQIYASADRRRELIHSVKVNGQVSNVEVDLKRNNGDVFTTLFSATPIQLGTENVLFVSFTDISERKEMEKALEEAARTDYLTGTLNRRAFSALCMDERQRANRNKRPISMLMLDIDHFKKINDTYGHDIGDEALKTLVHLIGQDLRSSDALGRVGGEEFVLLLPETDSEGALILAERIRQRIESHIMDFEGGKTLQMTVSGGLASWSEGQTYEDVLKVIDEFLYEAKNSGRNKIVSA